MNHLPPALILLTAAVAVGLAGCTTTTKPVAAPEGKSVSSTPQPSTTTSLASVPPATTVAPSPPRTSASVPTSASASPSTAVTRSPTGATGAVSLHGIEWSSATLPGDVCGLPAPVRLTNGTVRVPVPARIGAGTPEVDVTTEGGPTFGNLDGGEKDEAVLHIRCYNTGGTAAGHIQDSMVVFSGSTGAPRAIGVLHPQHHGVASLPSLDYFSPEVSIGPARVTVRENQYVLPQDRTCCPSIHVTTVWTYHNGAFSPSTTAGG